MIWGKNDLHAEAMQQASQYQHLLGFNEVHSLTVLAHGQLSSQQLQNLHTGSTGMGPATKQH